jgi:SAM-dependent methyltransferase
VRAETAPAQPRGGVLRRVARAVLWPLRRFFDPRFTGVHDAVQDVRRLLITDLEAANETTTLTGRMLDRLVAQNEEVLARLGGPHENSIDAGYERLASAYAFRALAAVPAGGSIAAVGATSSSVRALGALGYDVTTEHGLRTAHREGKFDAVLWLSTSIDEERLRLLGHLTKDGGILILSAAVGPRPVTETGRVYDQAGLDELLEGWEPADVTLVQRREPSSWTNTAGRIADLDLTVETVAMVTATKRSA